MKRFQFAFLLLSLLCLPACIFNDYKWLDVESVSPSRGTALKDGDTISITLSYHCPDSHRHLIGAKLHDHHQHSQSIGWANSTEDRPVTVSTHFVAGSMVPPYSIEVYLSCDNYSQGNAYTRAITHWLDDYFQ